jgi:hypothetical protein
LAISAAGCMADPSSTPWHLGSSRPLPTAHPSSLYRTLSNPVRQLQIGPPDTLLTRSIETIDNDCTAWLFTDAGLPPR